MLIYKVMLQLDGSIKLVRGLKWKINR